MAEQVRKIEYGTENLPHDVIVGVSIFRTIDGKREVLLVQGPSGKWYFPGGKMRLGENLEQCLERELREELGIQYIGELGPFTHGSYEINGKKLAIGNVTLDSNQLIGVPTLQNNDAVRAFKWTAEPLNEDLTDQARVTLAAQMPNTTIPDLRAQTFTENGKSIFGEESDAF